MAVNRFVLNGISYHGHGAIKEIPGLIKARGYHKAFVASDPDLVKFGVTAKVTDLLKENGIDFFLYDDIKPNPTIENIQHGVEAYKSCGADCNGRWMAMKSFCLYRMCSSLMEAKPMPGLRWRLCGNLGSRFLFSVWSRMTGTAPGRW